MKSKQEFLYFCDNKGNKVNFENNLKTKIKLLCTKCNTTYITTYTLFVTCKYTCQNCTNDKAKFKNKLPIDKVLDEINKRCQEIGYVFYGFCDRNGVEKEYSNIKDYLILECKECGYKWNTTNYNRFIHNKTLCPKCMLNLQTKKARLDDNIVLSKIKEKCTEKNYTFIKIVGKYTTAIKTRLLLKCNTCNKLWETTYNNFINGDYGCPNCNKSHLEEEIEKFLEEKQIEYITQYKPKWLNRQSLDFYLPTYNVGIECQGIQHFRVNKYFGGEEGLKITEERDKHKRVLCKENNTKLLYYSNLKIVYPYKVYESKEELLKEIVK